MAATRTSKALALALVGLACLLHGSGAERAEGRRSLLQAAAAAAAAPAPAAASAGACPIDPSSTNLDFTNVGSSCAAGKDICSTCVCALVDAFAPALRAGNVTYDAGNPGSFPLDAAAGVIRACSEQYLVSMLMQDINVTALAGLNACKFDREGDVPACLAAEVADLAPEAPKAAAPTPAAAMGEEGANVTATARQPEDLSYNEDSLSNVTLPAAAASPLRVATVQSTPAGPVFTLAGQLNSATQLLQAMASSDALVAAMAPAAAAELRALASDASRVEANPSTAAVLARLENPIDAVKLLGQVKDLSGGGAGAAPAPGAPAGAAPAPAPAPRTSDAAAARGAAAAVAGAAFLAALLL